MRAIIRFGLLSTCLAGLLVSTSAPYAALAATLRVGYVDTPQNSRVLDDLKRAFEAAGRNRTVQLVPVSYNELTVQLPQWAAKGDKADVFLLPGEIVSYVKGQNAFVGLGGLMRRQASLRQDLAAFTPGMLAVFSHAGDTIGVPLTASVQVLQHNVSLFRNAGLPPLSQVDQQWTWNELIDFGRRISSPINNTWLLHLDLEFAVVYFLTHGEVVSPDGRRSLIVNDANANILDLAYEAIRTGVSPPLTNQGQTSQRFQRGQLALRRVSLADMLPAAVARTRNQWPFEWDTAAWPRSPFSGQRPAMGSADGLVVVTGSKQVPLAQDFLAFAASRPGQLSVAKSGEAFPARGDIWAEVLNNQSAPPANRAALLESMRSWQYFTFPNVPPNQLDALAAPITLALSGRLPGKEALQQTHVLLQRILDQTPLVLPK